MVGWIVLLFPPRAQLKLFAGSIMNVRRERVNPHCWHRGFKLITIFRRQKRASAVVDVFLSSQASVYIHREKNKNPNSNPAWRHTHVHRKNNLTKRSLWHEGETIMGQWNQRRPHTPLLYWLQRNNCSLIFCLCESRHIHQWEGFWIRERIRACPTSSCS